MSRRAGRRRRLAELALCCLATAPPATAGPLQETAVVASWRVERLDREVDLAAGAALEIENRFGDLRVRAGEANRVRVHAVVQRDADDPRRLELEIVVRDGRLRVAVASAPSAAPAPPEWERRRADLSVEMPGAARLAAVTERGLLEVRGLGAALEAKSAAGDIRLRVGGPVDARTERGSIEAVLGGERWDQPARLEAPSGDIEVQLPPSADADVLLETQGTLTTDYSLTVEWTGPLSKRGRARLGRGGAEIVLRSGRGELAILRQPPAPVPAPLSD